MKIVIRVLYILLIVGIGLIISGFLTGASIESVQNSLTDQASYTLYEEDIDLTFDSIYVSTEYRNIDITVSDTIDKPHITYYLKETEEMSITVDGAGRLNMILSQDNQFFNWFSFGIRPSEYGLLSIQLPVSYVGDMNISTAAGNVEVDAALGKLDIIAQFGNVEIKGSYGDINIKVSAGNIKLVDLVSTGVVSLTGQSGNINLNQVEITDTLTATVSAGNVTVEKTNALSYTLKSSAGNVLLRLNSNISSYQFKLSTSAGDARINGSKVSNTYQSGTGSLVDVITSAGNINIYTN
ncbi:DUF4097 family beta strand repeat-containing protein [Acholeplasma laidlawii]|jgi:hypothetical protein|uniref:Conserved hypothetical surface-anchored protein n=1 Tax=Acholeplasma laidlawii (strain PG-8A) TaxID=441768 RepID=A9NE11_ACHLI|nr:DUF4097 family beta strand repeat-containing protein [Acholeplasma laidlawii]ABX81971.1 conserved hypothetical surface-anchored protein [Acholeplasma laidlawii PG-8A]NWH10952.1 DUF4097 family beta strand repeat protein [Acholeplasma laidlawii]OED28016.1 hypothetical protein A9269_00590 [Acholeplasma laidlawii]OED29357.1 hypothetical protein A9268_00570 [Acholeplasma laidlawii]OWU87339.1 hypothetical protein A8G01_04520 [Acholeplasma laidlawii]